MFSKFMKFSSDDLIWNVRHDVQRNMKINRMKKKPLNKPLGGRGHTILNEEQNLKLCTCTIIVHIILPATMQKGLICKKKNTYAWSRLSVFPKPTLQFNCL